MLRFKIFCRAIQYRREKNHFLLWKIDGLTEKSRFNIDERDFSTAKSILENDKIVLIPLQNLNLAFFSDCSQRNR